MRVGILGTGTLAVALGSAWAAAGHEVRVGGRSYGKAVAAARRIGGGAMAAEGPEQAVRGREAVLLAVAWEGVPDVLRTAGAGEGSLAGVTLIDPVNAVEHGAGVLLPEGGQSAAEQVARWAPGAHVVKAFHLFPAARWGRVPARAAGRGAGGPGAGGPVGGESVGGGPGAGGPVGGEPVAVVMAGDHGPALEAAGRLVRDAGGRPVTLGPLARARQLEEVAGFVIGLAFQGVDPAAAVPSVPAGA